MSMNVVALAGRLSRPAEEKVLESGDRLVASDEMVLSALTPLHYAPMLREITRVRLSTKHHWQMVLDDLMLAG